ncbi:hypothetical protein BGZ99_001711 [Dissophora globulifera]|uniref:RRM domain-containing protein n=1 Tax=Dissophora globulifera TaxID=979702 RepID=A0A9P6RT72_9FUNG|nr:hypothetical protein BGZ99_001711 [Dissophora globulifera]
MAIHSISNSSSSSSSSSSPILSSPSTSTTTPTASHCSPISPVSQSSTTMPMTATAFNILGNGHYSSGQDYSSSLKDSGSISGPFGMSDYFSSSIPKSSNNVNNNGTNGSSVHIGSLTSGLSGLSLAAQNYHPTTSSSLSSGLFSYSGNGNNSVANISFNGSSNGGQQEEISTIFVVGFPDDMQEREFQNMFVFTPGFEAATLKIPNKDQQEDDALTLGVNGVNPRKQIIGFAKFRTHQEALQAITVLSGRRVDAEKGSLLKAEMAKKNLHTRRGLSNELIASSLSTVTAAVTMPPTPIGINGTQSGTNNSKLPYPMQHRGSLAGSAAYDAFHSVPGNPALPSDLLTPNEYASSYDFYADVYAPNNLASLSFTESFGGRHQQSLQQQHHQQNQQHSELSSSFLGRQSAFDLNRVDPLSMGSFSNNIGGLAGSISGSFPTSISSSFTNRHIGLGGSQRFNKGFLDMDNDIPTTTSGYLSKSIPAHTERGFNSVLLNSEELPNPRFQGLPINTAAAAALASSSVPSPSVASPGFRPPVNPGDQNPPCNTLYVGNLPMNTSEDELRALFSRCVGYRRLSFRTKSNGPMCFVEFENIDCATQALNDLYGNPLSNSVKGGIRLSYSKNPLGVRNSTPSQLSGLGNQLHNMNGTPYLDRRDSMSAMFDQHY